jgi:hypothetical protein
MVRGVAWLGLLPALLGAIPGLAPAAPVVQVASFDVDGDGSADDALKLTFVETEFTGSLVLSQPVALQPDRSYCVELHLAVVNTSATLSGLYRFEIDLGPGHQSYLTPLIDAGRVYRDSLDFVVHTEPQASPGGGELRLGIAHSAGPVADPALYLDEVRVRPLEGAVCVDRFAHETFISDSTVLRWVHDLRPQGVDAGDHIGQAALEIVAWDDEDTDGFEYIAVQVNGIRLRDLEVDGTPTAPDVFHLQLPWLECRSGFDGRLQVQLNSVSAYNNPPGDIVLGSASAIVEAGRPGPSLLGNGDFTDGLRSWNCDGRPCSPLAARPTTWSALKRRYR